MKQVSGFLLAAGLAASMAAPAQADGFTYPLFEGSVNHIDLEECPEGIAEGDVFCRATMMNDALHIYVFEAAGDLRFVTVESFNADEFSIGITR